MRRSPVRLRLRRTDEGAIAILAAILSVLLFLFAALGVDIAMQINRKHQLQGTLDAAAQAGASELPTDTSSAYDKAMRFAVVRDASETGTLKPNVDFWCIVGATGSSAPYAVDTSQIPSTCYPGVAPYTVNANYRSTGKKITCSSKLCAIPCVVPTPNTGTPKIACNTIRVYQGRDVPFTFGPAGGIDKGSTGTLISVACKGPCGTVAPNPMDVAVVADRTGSMSSNMASLRSGIQGMLQVMTSSSQYVALGTLGKSSGNTPSSEPSGSSCFSASGSGTWVPIPFSNNYVPAGSTSLNSNSALVKALQCLPTSSSGTSLASPMKAAARYLLGTSVTGGSNNLSSLPSRPSAASKVLIMETDGQPNEPSSGGGGTTNLNNSADIYSPPSHSTSGSSQTSSTSSSTVNRQVTSGGRHPTTTTYHDTYNTTTTTNITSSTADGGQTACNNLLEVAANAKAAGIRVITIAYNLGGNTCGQDNTAQDSGGGSTSNTVITAITPAAARQGTAGNYSVVPSYTGNATVTQTTTVDQSSYSGAPDSLVTSTLAAAASPVDGVASVSQNTCKTAAEQNVENADGDNFFCAVAGADLAPIFKTALAQASSGIKLLNLP